MTGAQSGPMGMDARDLEPLVGDEPKGPKTHTTLGVGSVFGSIAAECAASVEGSIHPSSDGTIYSGFKARTAIGAIS